MRISEVLSVVLIAASLLTAGGASAQEPFEPRAAKNPQAKRLVAAFEDWAARYGVPDASFAAMRGGALIGTASVGARRPAKPYPVASLSKAITGVCIVKLAEAKKLSYRDTLGTLLKNYFKRNKPVDVRTKKITVAQLLTHSGGIVYDPTQGFQAFIDYDYTKTNMPKMLAETFTRSIADKTFFYNNMNYLALGMVIEAVTGEDYETYCHDTVLEPAGAGKAELNPDWRIMGAFGGWKISVTDYLRFMEYFRPKSRLMTSRLASLPKYRFPNGAFYGPGVYMRTNGSAYDVWHDGVWLFNSPTRQQNYGAYEAMIKQDVHYAVSYAPYPGGSAVFDLDNVLYAAATGAPVAAAAPQAAVPPEPPLAEGAVGRSDTGVVGLAIGRTVRE